MEKITMESVLGLSPEEVDEVTEQVTSMISTPLPKLSQQLQQQPLVIRQRMYAGYRFALHVAANMVLQNRDIQAALEKVALELDPYRP